jgi:hypothetical protein
LELGQHGACADKQSGSNHYKSHLHSRFVMDIGSTVLWPVEVVKPLFLPVGCLSLLPLEAFLIVLECFKAGHEKLMNLT